MWCGKLLKITNANTGSAIHIQIQRPFVRGNIESALSNSGRQISHTRKLTFTKTAAFTTAGDVDAKIAAKVGELKIGDETFATVKDSALSHSTERWCWDWC